MLGTFIIKRSQMKGESGNMMQKEMLGWRYRNESPVFLGSDQPQRWGSLLGRRSRALEKVRAIAVKGESKDSNNGEWDGSFREGKGEKKKHWREVFETKQEKSWPKRGAQPCLMLKQGEVRCTHSFHKDSLYIYDVAGTILGTKRERRSDYNRQNSLPSWKCHTGWRKIGFKQINK